MVSNRDASHSFGADGGVVDTAAVKVAPADEWLAGGGAMARTIRSVDWSATALGPIASWPQSLRTTVSLVQASGLPIAVAWGPGHVQIYNDGYRPLCGDKHPAAMGQDFRQCWASAFPMIGEVYAKAWSGQSACLENLRLFLDRRGFLEETWFTFSFSPITDESGGVGGLFHSLTETTSQMLSERRGTTLRALASQIVKAKTIADVYALSAQLLAQSDLDVPFLLFYQIEKDTKLSRLVEQRGLEPGSAVNPKSVKLDAAGDPFGLISEVVRTGLAGQTDEAAPLLAGMTVGPYPELPKTVLALPIFQPGTKDAVAVMVAGISSRLAMSESYRDFYSLIAATIGTALANAGAIDSAWNTAGALQRAIFNSANFSSIATDAKGVIQIFNVGAERMLGYTAAEVMNRITPADMSDSEEVIARAAALSHELGTPITPGFEALVFKASRGIEDIYELNYIRKDGSRFPAVVSVTALRDAQNLIIGYLLIGTDNTVRRQVEEERKKLDQRLRDQHFYTRSLIESNIDALMTTDPHGIITDVNKQMEALTGCSRDELIGAPFKDHFTDAARAEGGIQRVLREGKVTNYDLIARARDGKETEVSYNATTFYDRTRSLQGVFAAARDVTELKLFQLMLEQKNAELENASRMKSQFLANVSHELRTPLNSIIGFSEVLRDGLTGELTRKQLSFIADILASGKHLLSLINDILDLSKVEAGKMLLVLEPMQVSSLFTNSLSVVRERAAARHIRLRVETDQDVRTIHADPRKVKQILFNLVANAVKFTLEGGQVTLRASRVARADIGQYASAWPGQTFPLADNEFTAFLRISVKDSGIGIAPEGLAQLFKPFSQIDSGLSRRFAGTGLGLAIVKLLVELHGGAVAVSSAVGEGSCFTVWLPLRTPQEPGPAVAESVAVRRITVPLGARLALVVNDDDHAAALISRHLEAEGFMVLHANSAAAALAVARREPLSLIALNILLANMDGWEFLGRLTKMPDLCRVPVVILSLAVDRNKGFALGASAILEKPISRQELHASLVGLGLFPLRQGQTLNVLVVDDDPKAVELIAVRILGLASTVLRAYGGRQAIEVARQKLPDLIVLDLLMPDVNGFDVVEALKGQPDTARIPILVVTARQITEEDRLTLTGCVSAIMEKAGFDPDSFAAEVRRAMSGRQLAE